jgi:hypothetical protein
MPSISSRRRSLRKTKLPKLEIERELRDLCISVAKIPAGHKMVGGRKISIPSAIDIVMAVVDEGIAFDPLVAIRQIDMNSVKEIVGEPHDKSCDAKEQQQMDFQDMDGKVIVEYVVIGFSCVLFHSIHEP